MKWLDFLDHLLIFIWCCLVGILILGGILTVAPYSIRQYVTNETLIMLVAHTLLITSTLRFLQNKLPPHLNAVAVMIVGYGLVVAGIHILIYLTLINYPPHLYVAALVFNCIMCLFVPASAFIWDRIKPLPRPTRVRKLVEKK
jgi:hypothetical protein